MYLGTCMYEMYTIKRICDILFIVMYNAANKFVHYVYAELCIYVYIYEIYEIKLLLRDLMENEIILYAFSSIYVCMYFKIACHGYKLINN